MALTLDIGVASLALGVERVELLFETLVGRLARIKRAAEARRSSDDQASPRRAPSTLSTERLATFFKPKKRGPDQWDLVISRATMVSEE